MSFQERNVVSGLIVGIGFFIIYTWWVALPLRDGAFGGPEGAAALAKQTLWIIGGSIVVTIGVTILTEILFAIVTINPKTEQLVDERDRQIEKTGDRIGGHFASVVFLGALIALAMGTSLLWAIVIITYGFFAGAMLSTIIRLIQHRRGY